MKPTHVRIILVVDGAAVETRKILVDYTSRLCTFLFNWHYMEQDLINTIPLTSIDHYALVVCKLP
jgi:hypothetical protein